jgi:hypothetical protein
MLLWIHALIEAVILHPGKHGAAAKVRRFPQTEFWIPAAKDARTRTDKRPSETWMSSALKRTCDKAELATLRVDQLPRG